MPKNQFLSITDVTKQAYDYILEGEYARKTCQQYWYCGVMPIRRYFEQRNIEEYSPSDTNACVIWFRGQYEQGIVHRVKFQCVRKIAAIMECVANGETYRWGTLTQWNITPLPSEFHILLDNYAAYRRKKGYKETTIRCAKPIVKHFLMYVSSIGCEDIRRLTQTDIIGYIPRLAERYRRVGDALSVLRGFGSFLYEKGLTDIRIDNMFSLKVPSRKKLHVGFTKDEATQIIAAVDRSTECGKRDYAILMLAMHTGLRGVDVLNLEFSNIDWKKKEIHLVQSKTSQEITIPVPVSVLNAIADYILYARPESQDEKIIFLRAKRPYAPMKTWSAYSIVRRNAINAKIGWSSEERKGFHSFRRSIASWMLDSEIPLEMITEILGQRNTDSTKPYLAVHQSGLSECALDMRMIPIEREELR